MIGIFIFLDLYLFRSSLISFTVFSTQNKHIFLETLIPKYYMAFVFFGVFGILVNGIFKIFYFQYSLLVCWILLYLHINSSGFFGIICERDCFTSFFKCFFFFNLFFLPYCIG